MTDWEQKTYVSLSCRLDEHFFGERGYVIIATIKQEIKAAIEEMTEHISDNCDCSFCQRKRKIYKDRGIT